MKLAKKTRKRIYEAAAKHESLTISWPASAPEPLPGHKYRVKGFDPESRLEVKARTETATGWKVTVRLDTDPIRGLRTGAKKAPENPSINGPQFRAETEPEQVSSRYQRLLDSEGRIKTAMQGNLKRKQAEVHERERELIDKRKKGKGGKLLEAQIERQKRHLKRAA